MSEALERQKKLTAILADRLCVLICMLEDEELEAWLEGDDYVTELAKNMRALVCGFDEASEFKRAQLRCTDPYKTAENEVREMTKEILRQIYGRAA